jgi:hypothetical protein
MTASDHVLDHAEPCGHYVQFYKADEPQLNRNVGRFLWEGLLRGDGLLVVATAQRRLSLTDYLRRLGADVTMALGERQLIMLDADETLARFMVDGVPDLDLFNTAIQEALQAVVPRSPERDVRAYGEMVGVLWQSHQYEAAISLEDHWNKLLHVTGISLFCGYPIDVFGEDIENPNLHAVLCAHTHMVAGTGSELGKALDSAMNEVLGSQADGLRLTIADDGSKGGAVMPAVEASIFWLRKNLPQHAEGILSLARNYYDASQSETTQAAAS